MEEDFKIVPLILSIMNWHNNIVSIIHLNVLWLEIGSSLGTKHTSHLHSHKSISHCGLFLKGCIKLHSFNKHTVSSSACDHGIYLGHQAVLKGICESILKFFLESSEE